MPLIRESYPHLAPGYARLYRSERAPRDYTNAVLGLVADARLRWELPRMPSIRGLQSGGLPGFTGVMETAAIDTTDDATADVPPEYPTQLTLPLAA